MTTVTIEPTTTNEAPWSKHDRPARQWAHPALAGFVADHADALVGALVAYRTAHAALATLAARRDALDARARALRAELLEATTERAERLVRGSLADHAEAATMHERIAHAERRHREARDALLDAVERIARQEAQDLVDGIAEQRGRFAEVNRRLAALGANTLPELDGVRDALQAERQLLAPGAEATQRRAQGLLNVAGIVAHLNGDR